MNKNKVIEINTYKKNCGKYILDNTKYLESLEPTFDNFTNGIEVLEYITSSKNESKCKPVIIHFKSFSNESLVTLYSKEINFKKVYKTNKDSYKFYNLIPFVTYTWEVTQTGHSKQSGSFVITSSYRLIYFPKFFNVRDIGGKETYQGKRVKYGLLYRGPEFTQETYESKHDRDDHGQYHTKLFYKSDYKYLLDLGIKTEIDIRGKNEIRVLDHSEIEGLNYYILPMNSYRDFFEDGAKSESAKETYRKTFELFANADKEPVYIHCWGGADRTGTIVFLLEALLGVKMEDLVIDYELTTFVNNICRFKPYDASVDYFYRDFASMDCVMQWIKSYALPNETVQDVARRYLLEEIKVSQQTLDKIKKVFLE